MKITGKDLQENFFNKIKAVLPPNASLVDELSDLLQLSTDSIYRRLRNETTLSLDEIAILCDNFKVSFDIDSETTPENVTFFYSTLKGGKDLKEYLKRILLDLKDIKRNNPKKLSYAAIDVPLFHNFRFPDLAAFKVFYWLKGVMHDPILEGKKYDKKLIDPEILEIGHEVYNAYCQIPSVEIWTNETINSLLEHILYFWESGLFQSKEDALYVCELGINEIETIQKQADLGSKELNAELRTEDNSYMLYQSDIEIGNNAIMVEKGILRSVYISCHTLNYMYTMQPHYCTETKEWIENLIRKSTLISVVSEKQRYKFFKIALDKINSLREKIEDEGI